MINLSKPVSVSLAKPAYLPPVATIPAALLART